MADSSIVSENLISQIEAMGEQPRPDIGLRLRKIREHCGYKGRGTQKKFAIDFGFRYGQWNHWEQGKSMPWQQAVRLVEQVPGLTLDFIYLGRPDGLPFDLARRLVANLTAAGAR